MGCAARYGAGWTRGAPDLVSELKRYLFKFQMAREAYDPYAGPSPGPGPEPGPRIFVICFFVLCSYFQYFSVFSPA